MDITTLDTQIADDWRSGAPAREGFPDLASYSAWRRAEARGLVRVHSAPAARDQATERFPGNEPGHEALQRALATGRCRILGAPATVDAAPAGGERVKLTFDAPSEVLRMNPVRVSFAGSDRGLVTGLAAVFGSVNRKKYSFKAGSFKTAKAPVPMLWLHQHAKVIGHWHTLTTNERGLWAQGQVNLNVEAGREVFELMRSGDVLGLSVGVQLDRGDALYDMESGVEVISNCDLLEISVCPVPAEPGARVAEVTEG